MGYKFETPKFPSDFGQAIKAVATAIQGAGGDEVKWALPTGHSADGCQMMFSYGNQLFLVFIDVPDRPFGDGWRDLLLSSAVKANAIPCKMQLIRSKGGYVPVNNGWGLTHVYDDSEVIPPQLVTGAPVEMSDRELQSFAVNLIYELLEKDGYEICSCHTLTDVFPSMYAIKDEVADAVVVRSARVPQPTPSQPDEIQEMIPTMEIVTGKWYFAALRCASRDEDFSGPEALVQPILRGHDIRLAFNGLQEIEWRTTQGGPAVAE